MSVREMSTATTVLFFCKSVDGFETVFTTLPTNADLADCHQFVEDEDEDDACNQWIFQ